MRRGSPRAASIRRLGERLALLTAQAAELGKEISALGEARLCPLMRSKGSRGLTAGTLAGLLGCGQRFSREGQLASYAGVAPLEASSGGVVRHRLNRIGNRHRNAVSATARDPSVDTTRPRSSVA